VTFTRAGTSDAANPWFSSRYPALLIRQTTGSEIKNCTFNEDYSDSGQGIYMLYNDSILVHGNTIDTYNDDSNFAIEIAGDTGDGRGLRNDSSFYNNTLKHGISLVRGGPASLYGTSSWHVTIHDNIFDFTGLTVSSYAIELSHRFVDIYNNYFYDDATSGDTMDGIYVYNIHTDTIRIRGNVFYNMDEYCIILTEYSPAAFDGLDNFNNDCDSVRRGSGIHVKKSSTNNFTNISIRNNIIMNCGDGDDYAIAFYGSNLSAIQSPNITNNYYYGNDSDSCLGCASATGENIADNVDADPQINESGNRPDPYYRPVNGVSACVDAGIDVGLPFSGSRPDIGAYEYNGGSGSTIPAPPSGLKILSK
jgi:hypothetical protein